MGGRKNWAWAALVAAAAAAPAAAQTGGIGSGGQTGGIGLGGGSGLTSGGLTSSGLAGSLNSSNISGGSGVGAGGLGGSRSGTGSQSALGSSIAVPTGQARSSLQSSNMFSGYYANPYYAGIATQFPAAPGGFGAALYGATTGAGGGRVGGTGTALGTGLGAGRGVGGLGGTNQSGIVVPIPVQINYAAQIRFAAPPVPPGRIQADLRHALDNSSLIADGRAVEVVTDGQNNVTLRGRVSSEDESRLIEGVVRVTPGVRTIQNELTFPAGK